MSKVTEVRCGQCGQVLDDRAKNFLADGNAAIRRFIDEAHPEPAEPFAQWAATTGKALEEEITLWMWKSEGQKKRIEELETEVGDRRRDIDYLLQQQRDQLRRADSLIEQLTEARRQLLGRVSIAEEIERRRAAVRPLVQRIDVLERAVGEAIDALKTFDPAGDTWGEVARQFEAEHMELLERLGKALKGEPDDGSGVADRPQIPT